jgi:hypothetical protein
MKKVRLHPNVATLLVGERIMQRLRAQAASMGLSSKPNALTALLRMSLDQQDRIPSGEFTSRYVTVRNGRNVLQSLRQDGLLRRERPDADERMVFLSITSKGQQTLLELQAHLETINVEP